MLRFFLKKRPLSNDSGQILILRSLNKILRNVNLS
jgi:hypothetical protein